MIDELKCTPPPWTAYEGPLYSVPGARASVYGPDGDIVAAIWGNLAEEGDAYANARMIAQAQPMARLLKRLFDYNLGPSTEAEHPDLLQIIDDSIDVLQAAGVKLP